MEKIDDNLKQAIQKLESDSVKIVISEGTSDQKIKIETEHYSLIIGANDLGVWLEKFVKKK